MSNNIIYIGILYYFLLICRILVIHRPQDINNYAQIYRFCEQLVDNLKFNKPFELLIYQRTPHFF